MGCSAGEFASLSLSGSAVSKTRFVILLLAELRFNKNRFKEIKSLAVTSDMACIIADGKVYCGSVFASISEGVADDLNRYVPNPLRIATVADSIGGNLVSRFCVMSPTNIHCDGRGENLGPDSNGVPLLNSPLGPVNDFPYRDVVGIDGSLCVAGAWPTPSNMPSPRGLFIAGEQICALDENGSANCWQWFDALAKGDGKIRDAKGLEVFGIADSYYGAVENLRLRLGSTPLQILFNTTTQSAKILTLGRW